MKATRAKRSIKSTRPIAARSVAWTLLALLFPVLSFADESDSIRTVTPLFEPIVVEDSIPDFPGDGDATIPESGNRGTGETEMGFDSKTTFLRSDSPYRIGTPYTDAGVSPLGAALWSMAFEVPPGVGGMAPSVGLAYSSQSGMGNAGWGISVTGVSSITRGMKTLYHDGSVRGVRYDSGDALFLDGRRLLLSSGTEGMSDAEYVPEGDPFTTVRITSYNSSSGPISFEVTSPDGMVSLYGTTYDSRLSVSSADDIRNHAWFICRREDPSGNYIEYSYMHDSLTVYPQAIKYGKNKQSSAGAYNTVWFYYTDVQDGAARPFVIGGNGGCIQKCLQSVKMKTGSSVFRDYVLSYTPVPDNTTLKFQRLSSVSCRNGNGDRMRPVDLSWSPLPGREHTPEILNVSTYDANPMVVKQDSLFLASDLTGDGLADIVRISNCKFYHYNYPNAQEWEWQTYIYVHRSVRGADGSVTYLSPLRYELGSQICFDDWKDLIGSNTVADIDGDGLGDIVIPYYVSLPSGDQYMRFRCIKGRDVRNGSTASYLHWIPLTAAEEIPPFVSGDLDGNGLDDVACLENRTSNGHYCLDISLSLPSDARDPVSIPLTLPGNPKRLFLCDCNSDGLSDLIALYDGGHKIFYNNGGSTASSLFSDVNSTSGTSFGNKWRVEQGDFNGDGLADFVYVGGNSTAYYFALNKGNGKFNVTLAASYNIHDQDTDRDDHRFTLTPIDIDRDGITDLVVSKADFEHHGGIFPSNSFIGTDIGWLISDGSSLTEVRRVRSGGLIEEAGSHNIMVADFDGDGWPELANNGADWFTNATAGGDGCHVRVYHDTGFLPCSGKLTAARDALGATSSFTYGISSDPALYTQVYESSGSNTFPLADIHSPLVLVSAMTRNDGLTGTHTTAYRYANLKAHLQGKGLLGFLDVAVRDNLTGVTTQSGTWALNTAHYVPSMTYSITSMGYDNDSTVTTISVQPNAASRYMTFPVSKRNVDMDGNVTTASTGYNVIEGYVTEERTEYGSADMYREVRYSDYVKKGGRWLPRTVNSEQKHADDPMAFSTTTFTTYSDTGNPISVTEHYGSQQPLTTVTTYDTWGNALTVSKSGQGVSPFTEYRVFDVTGRFLTRNYRSQNGEDMRFTHDTWGNVLTETDASEASNLLTTTYQRDGWGDVLSVTDPMGITEIVSTGWGSTDESCYYVLREAPGKAPVKTWHDVRGREHMRWTVERKGVESTEIVTLNARGDVRQIVRNTGNRIFVETYGYDTRGRVNWTFRTGHGETTYTYGNRSRTAQHGGREYVTTYDAWGNVLTSTDPVSSVEYTYGSIGKPVSIISGGSEVTIQYDQAGRRVRMEDPDAGIMEYTYSADGKLLSQTDGRGVTTQNTYDALGRLASSVSDTLTTTYTYGTSGHGKLRLVKRQTGPMSDEFTYDPYGRVVFSKRTFPDGVQMGHTFTYDSLGHLSGHMYPSNYNITYTYDANGYRYGIWAGNAHLWRVQDFDGVTTTYHYGNTTVTDSISGAGQLLERYAVRDGQSGKLCRMAFIWDGTTGNMASRTGVGGADVTEAFTYDTLDRLTGVSRGGSVTDAITYGDDGNILSRTGMGDYAYLSGKPHAVTSVDNTDYLIASASQQIDYNPLGKAVLIREGTHSQRLFYGPDGTRWLTVDSVNGQVTAKTYYHDDFEMRVAGGHTRKYHYLEERLLTYMYDSSLTDHYYLVRDNVGSVTHVLNGEGGTMFDACYDAWGRQTVTKDLIGFHRGYGGHEMLPQYRLVNMDGRLYDYALGRFLSPDNYVQEPDNSQNFNRYTYCLNNPLKYTDPDGDSYLLATIIGAAIGTYIGGSIANNSYNPIKWNYSSAKTWGYMLSGGIVGGISGYAGAAISHAGFAGSNTLGILASSGINSLGTHAYTLGATPIVLSAGIFSYDVTNNKFGYLGKKGNSDLENLGYALGAMANVRDINNIFDATPTNLYTQTFEESNPDAKDYISHTSLVANDKEIIMSYGPADDASKSGLLGFAVELRKSNPYFNPHIEEGVVIKDILLNKHLFSGLRNISRYFPYQGITSNCVNWASLGLWLNGIPNIGIHPYFLHGSIAAYKTGIYNILAIHTLLHHISK